MSESVVATGASEVIEALVTDANGASLTGLTDIKAGVRRKSDGKLLDWNDMTFKSSGWTTRQLALTETSAANEPGWYRYTWDMSTIVSPAANDVYTVTVRQTSLTTAKNVPQVGVIRTGVYVDTIATNLTVATSTLATPTNITAGTITTVTNLTNAPTSGDLTATMKASVTTAATAATPTAAAVTGSVGSVAANGITSTSIAVDAINAAAVKADAVTKIQNGLATSAALATAQGDLTAIQGVGFTAGVDDLHSARAFQATLATSAALATAQGNITTILGYGAPPSASTISTQVASDLATAHGAGSWITASVAGLALEATLTAIKGASWGVGDNLHTIAAFGAPPSAATISAQVASDLATAHGAGSWLTADISTLATSAALASVATDATKARRALYNRRTLSAGGLFTLYADDAVTSLYTATVTDVTGGAITVSAGEPARTTALV